MKFSIIKQNRFRILICEGFRYSRYMVVYNKEYWRCTDRSCRGKLHLSGGRIVYVKKNGHNHGPDHKGVSADQALFVMRKRVYNERTPFKQIYSETVREFEESGHGPMKELLPYGVVKCAVLNQAPEAEGQLVAEGGPDGAAELQVMDQTGPSGGDGLRDGLTVAAHQTKPELSEVAEVEVLDCTAVTTESSITSQTTSIATTTTCPHDLILLATHPPPLSRGGRTLYSASPAYGDKRAPAATITTPGGLQPSGSMPGLRIHSTYSLQPAGVNASTTSPPDRLPGTSENHDATASGMDQPCATIRSANPTRETFTKQSANSSMQGNSNSSRPMGKARADVGHSMALPFGLPLNPAPSSTGSPLPKRKGGVLPKASGSRATPTNLSTPRPNAAQPVVTPVTLPPADPVPPGPAFTELQMRLARKEHRLRLQYMKERHSADMVLVHLQQELVREQLRELRQPGTGAGT